VKFTAAGACTIDANQEGDTHYNAAPQKQQTVTVGKSPQTITFTSTPPNPAFVGGPAYTVTAEATSKQAVTFTIDPASSSVCTISGSTVTFVAAGTCTIDANQGGNTQYEPAAQAQQSFTVGTVTVVAPPPSHTPSPSPPATPKPLPANSNFIAGTSSFEPASGRVILIESISNGGTFRWLLTVPNGKFGVLVSSKPSKKCKAGLVRLRGRCGPSTIVFSEGTAVVPAGVVIFKLRPSPAALKLLQSAFRHKKGVLVTATFTFQSSRGGAPVTRTQTLLDKLKKK
jgi:hypothetical protein